MRRLIIKLTLTLVALGAPPASAFAQSRSAIAPQDSGNPLPELISGYEFNPVDIRALQDDDFDNPGFVWVARGEALWSTPDGATKASCASCHGDKTDAMQGRAADYPKFYQPADKVINLEQRINLCRLEKMNARPWAYGSEELLGITAYLRLQSRGLPVKARVDGPAKAVFEKGQKTYNSRMGQLGMSCAQCHDKYYGKSFRDQLISQGHSNGFPAYMRKSKSLRSLHGQFTECYGLMKAEPHAPGSEDYIALELYLAWRGAGLPLEAPAVRR